MKAIVWTFKAVLKPEGYGNLFYTVMLFEYWYGAMWKVFKEEEIVDDHREQGLKSEEICVSPVLEVQSTCLLYT